MDENKEGKELVVSNEENKNVFVYCPSCGFGFKHELSSTGKTTGGVGGAAAGAALGAKVGIVAGPIGAIAGTIPGAILGAIFGAQGGAHFDKPVCPKCETKFSAPE